MRRKVLQLLCARVSSLASTMCRFQSHRSLLKDEELAVEKGRARPGQPKTLGCHHYYVVLLFP
jgi:hypothetical protein